MKKMKLSVMANTYLKQATSLLYIRIKRWPDVIASILSSGDQDFSFFKDLAEFLKRFNNYGV